MTRLRLALVKVWLEQDGTRQEYEMGNLDGDIPGLQRHATVEVFSL